MVSQYRVARYRRLCRSSENVRLRGEDEGRFARGCGPLQDERHLSWTSTVDWFSYPVDSASFFESRCVFIYSAARCTSAVSERVVFFVLVVARIALMSIFQTALICPHSLIAHRRSSKSSKSPSSYCLLGV